ncbi:Pkr1-domain-containing protein [Hanseniaspora valbyensis NRRL Y-1626]|uniref:Pkr1-domain-containing protein n=1 Tax=Hanseniaspora valbyensis NRRL Y-1626 TaxID=766949 RepID=A0A1B7TG66_9ASCO|nr:Pkr1-domain-containing protein [Hanseniaspora valbyensis NRRL Y-1626]
MSNNDSSNQSEKKTETNTLASGNGLVASIFQPGANKTLLICTHLSFVALIITLSTLVYISKYNIHYINLLVIAICLYSTVNWFIIELGKTDLKTNEQLQQEAAKKEQ